ncbi:MAG: LLM class flavin-dependent oxidoreductase [Acidobacteriota bacterium]
MDLKFHWRLLQGGEKSGITRAAQADLLETALPDLKAQINFCRAAEESGIDSLLTDINFAKPDPLLLGIALALSTHKMKFMIAARSGLLSPALFVQQVNTFSALADGRISLNIVAGHSPDEQRYYGDFLLHDERYARTDEFLAICHAFWERNGEVNFEGRYFKVEDGRLNTPFVSAERTSPEIFIGGSSAAARDLAIRRGSCWMRLADKPESLAQSIAPVLDAGKEVGLRLSLIARATREEALSAAHHLIEGLEPSLRERQKEAEFVHRSDSESVKATFTLAEAEWLTPILWTGAVRYYGSPAIALVGTPEEIASAIMEYRKIGISQFIFSGWPKLGEMIYFGKEVLPLVRKKESVM